MEFLQLRYFQTVARLEHMTKAAKELHVSQPSLSNTISRLEKRLGVPLFVREGRQIRLTPFGRVFLKRVDRILLELEEGEYEIKEMAGLDGGVISVAMTLPTHFQPMFIKRFLQQHPNVRMKQLQASSKSAGQLANAEIDLCISTNPITGPDIEWLPLLEEEILLSVPQHHRLATRESIDLREAAHEKFISLTPEFEFRRITEEFCHQAGFAPNIYYEFEEPGTQLHLVEMGLGVSFTTSLSQISPPVPITVQLRIHDPKCTRTIGIAWNRNHYLSDAAKQFRQYAIDFFTSALARREHGV